MWPSGSAKAPAYPHFWFPASMTILPPTSIKRAGAYKRHILTKKSTKRKRQMRRASGAVDHSNKHQVLSVLPYSR